MVLNTHTCAWFLQSSYYHAVADDACALAVTVPARDMLLISIKRMQHFLNWNYRTIEKCVLLHRRRKFHIIGGSKMSSEYIIILRLNKQCCNNIRNSKQWIWTMKIYADIEFFQIIISVDCNWIILFRDDWKWLSTATAAHDGSYTCRTGLYTWMTGHTLPCLVGTYTCITGPCIIMMGLCATWRVLHLHHDSYTLELRALL